jgi:uncharacterized Fe-S cluster-containing radical SAM superfamily protein
VDSQCGSLIIITEDPGQTDMKIMTSIALLFTYDCNAACDHCYYHSKPGKTGYITPAEAEGYFDSIIQNWGELTNVRILGGEPFIYYRPLLEIIRLASRHKANVTLLTNGVWGGSESLADRVARELKEAGVTIAVIGSSGFHAPYVPPDTAVRAARAARRHGIKVAVANYVLESLDAENRHDLESRRLDEMCKEFGVYTETSGLDWQGRASSKLVQLSSAKAQIPTGICPNILIGKIKERTNYAHGLVIDAGGWVTVCHGIAIGNTRHEPLDQIIRRYNPNTHPITRLIREKGPIGLLDLPEAANFKPKPNYKSLCHMCFEIRKHLRPQYPNELNPDNCYQETP